MRRGPRVFAFVSAPIDTPTLSPFPILPLAHSLQVNAIGAEGATALAAILNETKITNLECAAPAKRLLLCQRPLTHLLSNWSHPTPRTQSRRQRHRSRGSHCDCCHPQRDEDHQPPVRRPREAFAFVSAPLDTPQHPLRSRARSLRDNKLGLKGGAALADGLKGNSTLKELK